MVVLSINASTRKDGNTQILLDTVLEQLERVGIQTERIYQYVFALANGGGADGFFFDDWANTSRMASSCCNDGLRPVVFELEATDIPDSVK